MKIDKGDRNLSLWWKYNKVIKFITLVIWGLLIDLINFALLSLAVFGHFDTFPDGWVGGGKIKNKDHLSLAEAYVEAELGPACFSSIHPSRKVLTKHG